MRGRGQLAWGRGIQRGVSLGGRQRAWPTDRGYANEGVGGRGHGEWGAWPPPDHAPFRTAPAVEPRPPEPEPTYQELRGARGDIYSSLTQ